MYLFCFLFDSSEPARLFSTAVVPTRHQMALFLHKSCFLTLLRLQRPLSYLPPLREHGRRWVEEEEEEELEVWVKLTPDLHVSSKGEKKTGRVGG